MTGTRSGYAPGWSRPTRWPRRAASTSRTTWPTWSASSDAGGRWSGLLGHNVLRDRRWARLAAIAFGCLNIVLGILAIVRGTPSGCVSIGLQAVVIGLLMTTAAGGILP